MYSLLLMTAMTTGGDVAGFGWRSGGCHGCSGAVVSYGCSGSCSGCWGSSCYGSSCYGSSCYGSSCNGGGGCSGSCHGERRGMFGRLFHRGASCHGCYGSSCHGCNGGSCNGCWGSSCYGGGCNGCHGGAVYYHQGCYGSMTPYSGGCNGCFGGGYTPYVPSGPVIMEPVPAAPVPAAPTPVAPMPEKKASANITVELPAGATLYVDGQAVAGTGATRQFHTPELPAGQAFYYDMKAEIEVGGRKVAEEMKVVVAAGDKVAKSFGQLIAAANGTDKAVAVK